MKNYGLKHFPAFFSVVCPPVFTKIPENVEALEEDSIEFKVEAYGKPVPEISWSLGDVALTKDDRRTVQSSANDKTYKSKSSLSIGDVQMTDTSDVYRIEAKNKVGSVTHDVALLGKEINDEL